MSVVTHRDLKELSNKYYFFNSAENADDELIRDPRSLENSKTIRSAYLNLEPAFMVPYPKLFQFYLRVQSLLVTETVAPETVHRTKDII